MILLTQKRLISRLKRAFAAGVLATGIAAARPAEAAGGIVDPRLLLATRHIEKLEVVEAAKVMADIPEEGDALIVHTLLALYTGDCDRAAAHGGRTVGRSYRSCTSGTRPTRICLGMPHRE